LFKEISIAYKTLSDPATRKKYDSQLERAHTPRPAPKARTTTTKAPSPAPKAYPAGPIQMGKNLLFHLAISLEDAFHGAEKTIKYMRTVNGNRQTSQVTVRVPPGIRDEKKLRVRGAGESLSTKQTPGDLVVVIHVAPHPLYTLEGSDVIVKMPISPLDLLHAEPITVPSLHGPQRVDKVELDEFQHSTLRLKDRGFPLTENSKRFGDLFVRFVIDVPASIDENLKNQLRKIKKELPKTALQKELEKYLRS